MTNKFDSYISALGHQYECADKFRISADIFALVPSEQNLIHITTDTAALATANTQVEYEVALLNQQLPTVGT